jgi:hypothetical protein
MQTLLTDFRTELLDRLLDVLWRQWTTLGVSGRGQTWLGPTIDPDALLLLSCTIARYDARLFDAMLEWLRINGRFVSVQRIKRVLRDENFSGERVLRAVAAATSTSVNEIKWARLIRDKTSARERNRFSSSRTGTRYLWSTNRIPFSKSTAFCAIVSKRGAWLSHSILNPSAIYCCD